MWINFCSLAKRRYLVKIYVGGVNAISGEPALETTSTVLRRQKGGMLQDYVVLPKQPWLDGIADTDGFVRQFVATPFGTGRSIEAQITGEEVSGGIQIEVTPYKLLEHSSITHSGFPIYISPLSGKLIELVVTAGTTIGELKSMIQEEEGHSPNVQRLIFSGKQLEGSCMHSPSYRNN